jgi:hypothetical protein
MKKLFFSIFIMLVLVACNTNQKNATQEQVQVNPQQEQVQANPQQELEKKIADFQQRHDRLKSLPSRSYHDGGLDYSNYPDDYYNKTQQLYREEIAFNLEQYGEEATAKVVFLLNQIPVTGQYFIGKIEVDEAGLRYRWAHKYHPEAFDAVCAQIAHKTINSICDYALGLAMGYGYKQMAQSIIRCYKPDIVITKTKDELTYDTDEYKVSTTYQSRDNAKARIADL